MWQCYSPTRDGDSESLAEARKGQQMRPAAGGRSSDRITQGLTGSSWLEDSPAQQRVTRSVGSASDTQKGSGGSILVHGLRPKSGEEPADRAVERGD